MVSFYQKEVCRLVVADLLLHPEEALDSALTDAWKYVVACYLRQDWVRFRELAVEQAAVAIYKNNDVLRIMSPSQLIEHKFMKFMTDEIHENRDVLTCDKSIFFIRHKDYPC